MSTNHHHYLQYHHGVAFEKTLWSPRLLKILSIPTEKNNIFRTTQKPRQIHNFSYFNMLL